MSHEGPKLSRTKRGHAVAKFNGKARHFGDAAEPHSHVRFLEFKAKWEAAGRTVTPEMEDWLATSRGANRKTKARKHELSVAQLFDRYVLGLKLKHSEQWLANNLYRTRNSMALLIDLFADTPVAKFSPLRLKEVRQAMIEKETLCRREINDRIKVDFPRFRRHGLKSRRIWRRRLPTSSVDHGCCMTAGRA